MRRTMDRQHAGRLGSAALGAAVLLAGIAAWLAAAGLTACAAHAADGAASAPVAPARGAPVAATKRVVTRVEISAPDAPDAPAAPGMAPLAPMPDEVSARGWFGMAFTCSECDVQARVGDRPPVWDFGAPPQVYRVEPGGPAEKAGILPGDVLVRLDGAALDSGEGGRRFGAVQPGQKVQWTVRRGTALKTLAVIAGERPGQPQRRELKIVELDEQLARLHEMRDMEQMRAAVERARAQLAELHAERVVRVQAQSPSRAVAQPLRYVGQVGCSRVDVRGMGAVNVTVSQDGDELIITTGDATVRVRTQDKAK
jgi:hypothetical protein